MLNRFLFGSMVALTLSGQSFAAIVFSTDFNGPTYSDGGLIGQDGWLITGTSVVSPIAVANTGTNGNVTLTTTGQDVNRPFAPTATLATATNVFLSATLNFSAAQTNGDYFLHLGDGGTSNFLARIFARQVNPGFVQLAMTTSSGTPLAANYGIDLAVGTPFTILARYDFVTGAANDTGALFVNPLDPRGVGDTPYIAALTAGTDAAVISSVNLRQGTAANAPSVTIDNISVDVAAVPEPSSMLLLASIGIVIVGARYRRNRISESVAV